MIRIADPNYSTDQTACYSCGFGQLTATTPERRTFRYRLESADVAGVETGDMIFLHIDCAELAEAMDVKLAKFCTCDVQCPYTDDHDVRTRYVNPADPYDVRYVLASWVRPIASQVCLGCGMATRAAIDQPTYPYSNVYCSACQLRP